jgi:acetyl-CoA carboxylase carboxyltransferase component
VHVAEHFEIDDVIDPALTRQRFVHALDAASASASSAAAAARPHGASRRAFVDTW